MKRCALILLACTSFAACSFYARSPNDYRTAMRKVLEQKQPEVEACYKQSYDADKSAQGKVVASFEVEQKTGKVLMPTVVPAGTTANEALQKCVIHSLDGLVLDPPDQRKGAATFTWDFSR